MSGTPLRLKSSEVDPIGVRQPVMQRLARVLFHVDPRQADDRRPRAGRERDAASGREGPLVLRNLVALGQVRIEVVLAREDRPRLHRAPERERRAHRQLDRAPVEHRQRARQTRGTPDRRCVFGGAPNAVEHPQKILVAVSSCAWIFEADDGLVLNGRHMAF